MRSNVLDVVVLFVGSARSKRRCRTSGSRFPARIYISSGSFWCTRVLACSLGTVFPPMYACTGPVWTCTVLADGLWGLALGVFP